MKLSEKTCFYSSLHIDPKLQAAIPICVSPSGSDGLGSGTPLQSDASGFRFGPASGTSFLQNRRVCKLGMHWF